MVIGPSVSRICTYDVSSSDSELTNHPPFVSVVNDMLNYTSKSYGDEGFINRIAGNDNRLKSLQSTDLLIQSALVPNSRVRSNEAANNNDAAVYVGHLDKIYTVPISAAYIINVSGTFYSYSTELEDMEVSISPTSKEHSFEDWEDFHLYPGGGQWEGLYGSDNRKQ